MNTNMWYEKKDKIKMLNNRKEFFIKYYDRCPALAKINIDLCDKKLKTL